MTREITPHKGGRDAALYIRCTPEMLEQLAAICERTNESQADVVHRLVEAEAKENEQ